MQDVFEREMLWQSYVNFRIRFHGTWYGRQRFFAELEGMCEPYRRKGERISESILIQEFLILLVVPVSCPGMS